MPSPLSPLNLLPLPNIYAMVNRDGLSKANFVKTLHEKGKAQIEKKIEQYARYSKSGRKKMVIKWGDWVWIHLRKNRFTFKRKSKLQEKGDSPFQVLKRINYNAYKIALPLDYGVRNTFNVTDLTLRDVGTFDINSRANSSQEGGYDRGLSKEEEFGLGELNMDGPIT